MPVNYQMVLGQCFDGRKCCSKTQCDTIGIYRGAAVAGCEPDEMGIGPIYAIPKLLKANGLKMDDIGLWELPERTEAFAVQVLYCRDHLGIPNELMNVNGGAISIGHPYGMSGARMVAHALIGRKTSRCKICSFYHVCRRGNAAGLLKLFN